MRAEDRKYPDGTIVADFVARDCPTPNQASNDSGLGGRSDILGEVKTIQPGRSSYIRRNYRKRTLDLDRAHAPEVVGDGTNGQVGPFEEALGQFHTGNVFPIVAGAFGEVNEDASKLVTNLARLTAKTDCLWKVDVTASQPQQERRCLPNHARSWEGWAGQTDFVAFVARIVAPSPFVRHFALGEVRLRRKVANATRFYCPAGPAMQRRGQTVQPTTAAHRHVRAAPLQAEATHVRDGVGNEGPLVRTMAPSEVDIVVEDILHVKSFYAGEHEAWMERSRSRCGELRAAGYAATPDARTSCSLAPERGHGAECLADHKRGVGANPQDRVIARGGRGHTGRLSEPSQDMELDLPVHRTERLAGYDYVWFIDGDNALRSLNWQGFWQQIMLLRPKIAQGGAIGSSPERPATVHKVLRHNGDARVMAAEVPIVEVQAPLLEVDTWIAWRDFLANDPKPMERFEVGGSSASTWRGATSRKTDLRDTRGTRGCRA
ncbi:hypothetical protein THAOC_06984 [Thalassiosira oceanica]|uniref:Uncharacterized protein n=1 Tax=Thalassiosira oceanica TaxID=159749 RepID=K0TL53_THAOC|nr:hypothetical protein THAOC_06984 [Thalassiosira oceanica]|eukprot:EJK71557.1 hypothetical protein THAOC_06984 [Thalassiosira oceanica]